MTVNFEADLGEKLYDCDASVATDPATGETTVDLLEVRLVSDDGETFTVVQPTALPPEVLIELKKRAESECQWQIETAAERSVQEGLLGPS